MNRQIRILVVEDEEAIAQGLPATQMPAFGERLGDEEIEALVNKNYYRQTGLREAIYLSRPAQGAEILPYPGL